jgi:uncharacterized protein
MCTHKNAQDGHAEAAGLLEVGHSFCGTASALCANDKNAQDGHAEAAGLLEVGNSFGGTASALCANDKNAQDVQAEAAGLLEVGNSFGGTASALCAGRELIAQYIEAEAKPREKFGHQPRLYALTLDVGRGFEYDDDVVYAAAWLHDLGVFTGHRPEELEELMKWDNTKYAMEQAPALLSRFQFPAEKIIAVVETIRTHQPAFDPQTIEGKILRDADILEQLGAVGILRTVCKVGRDTRFEDFSCAVRSLEKALADLPAKLILETARQMAKPRIEVMQEFLASVKREAGSCLY